MIGSHAAWTTFTFMHLADAFIQSDLHCIQVTVSTFYQLLLSLGIEPMILALLTPCSTSWATGKLLRCYSGGATAICHNTLNSICCLNFFKNRDAPIDWPVIGIGRFLAWPAQISDWPVSLTSCWFRADPIIASGAGRDVTATHTLTVDITVASKHVVSRENNSNFNGIQCKRDKVLISGKLGVYWGKGCS